MAAAFADLCITVAFVGRYCRGARVGPAAPPASDDGFGTGKPSGNVCITTVSSSVTPSIRDGIGGSIASLTRVWWCAPIVRGKAESIGRDWDMVVPGTPFPRHARDIPLYTRQGTGRRQESKFLRGA